MCHQSSCHLGTSYKQGIKGALWFPLLPSGAQLGKVKYNSAWLQPYFHVGSTYEEAGSTTVHVPPSQGCVEGALSNSMALIITLCLELVAKELKKSLVHPSRVCTATYLYGSPHCLIGIATVSTPHRPELLVSPLLCHSTHCVLPH